MSFDSFSGSDEGTDEIGETLDVDSSLIEQCFSSAISKGGSAYLDKLEMTIINDPELENDVQSILESFSFLKSFIGDGGEHANKLSLQDLEDFGITSEQVRHRIGVLAFLMGNRSPSTSNRHRRESSVSGIQSQASGSGEYEDDFEAIDDADESPRVRLRKYQHSSANDKSDSNSNNNNSRSRRSNSSSSSSKNVHMGESNEDSIPAVSRYMQQHVPEREKFGVNAENFDDENEYTVEYDDCYGIEDDDNGNIDGDGTRPSHEKGAEGVLVVPQNNRELNEKRAPTAPQLYSDSQGARERTGRATATERVGVGQSVDNLGYIRGSGTRHKETRTAAGSRADRDDIRRASSAGAALTGERRKSRGKVAAWIRDKKWTLGEKIGSGSFGEVYQGLNDLGRLFAVKRLHIAGQRNVVDELANEIQLMRDYAHPNIVGYLGADVDESQGVVNIFQEWVPGGSLAHLLKRFGAFSEHVVANYTRQIVSGLAFLHSNGIIHRDIKGGNVLVDELGSVKLADFGASTKVNPAFDRTQETSHFKGTPYFMAPEVLGQGKYGRKGDIWAVGCTMIQMLTGQPPWKDRNLSGLVQLHLLLSDWEGPPLYPSHKVSPECQECIEQCFAKDESKRPSAKQLLQCVFLSEADNLEDSGRIFDTVRNRSDNTAEGGGLYAPTTQRREGRRNLVSDENAGTDEDRAKSDGMEYVSENPRASKGVSPSIAPNARSYHSGGRSDEVSHSTDHPAHVDAESSTDTLEDSGIAQMAKLRAQMARLARSTESLPGALHMNDSAGEDSGNMPMPSREDSVEAVQRQIARRKLVKQAVDMSRRNARKGVTDDGDTDDDNARGRGVQLSIKTPEIAKRERALTTDSNADNELSSGSNSSSQNNTSQANRKSSNPYARGAGTQRIGVGANRTPKDAVASLMSHSPYSSSTTSNTPDSNTSKQRHPVIVGTSTEKKQQQLGNEVRKDDVEVTRIDTRRPRAQQGHGNISTARDGEELSPPDDIISPNPYHTGMQTNEKRDDDNSGEKGVDVSWTCLACSKSNTEPGYCVFCSVVRGSSGKKGVSASVIKRSVGELH